MRGFEVDYILLATIIGMALYLMPDEWIDLAINRTPIIKNHKILFGVTVFTGLFAVLIICSWSMYTSLTPKGQQLFLDFIKWPALLCGIAILVTIISTIWFFVEIDSHHQDENSKKGEQP